MPEPTTSSAAAGAAGWKLIGGAAGAIGLGAALASTVVMLMSVPRSGREWAVGLISTVISSIGGGAFVILKFGLLLPVLGAHTDAELIIALMGLLGLVFACGLPGWAIVRWSFTWIERRRDRDLGEVAGEAAQAVRDAVGGRS